MIGDLNVFPLNMYSKANDLMLRLDSKNCDAFKNGLADNYETLKNMTKGIE